MLLENSRIDSLPAIVIFEGENQINMPGLNLEPCNPPRTLDRGLWVVRVGGDDGELRPWHYIYVYSIESRLIMRVR